MALLLEAQEDAHSPCGLHSPVHEMQEVSARSYLEGTDPAPFVFCRAGSDPLMEIGTIHERELGEITLRELANAQ